MSKGEGFTGVGLYRGFSYPGVTGMWGTRTVTSVPEDPRGTTVPRRCGVETRGRRVGPTRGPSLLTSGRHGERSLTMTGLGTTY